MRRVAAESGANISTVNRLANNTIKRIPVDELTLLCRYLQCDVGDMLGMEEPRS
jgi:DNA-binding Xre family transcriptional regulator